MDIGEKIREKTKLGNPESIGLVLSGGGAKGAYQAGVIKALAEMNVRVDAVSGASIGALNGAVFASSRSVAEGAERLEKLWRTLAEEPPLEGEVPASIRLLEAAGLKIKPTVRNTAILAKEVRRNFVSTITSPETGYLVNNGPIKKLLDEYVSYERLASGLPLYVSIFPNRGFLESVVGFSLAFLEIKDTPKSEFVHLQTLSAEEQQKTLLASAAIPFLLEAQEINGGRYSDGGIGGRLTSQGNTPIEPLIQNGYSTVIVASLSDRAKWNRQKYPDTEIIEIGRLRSIDRNPVFPEVFDTLAFHPKRIYPWIEQGYEDARRCLEPRLSHLRAR